MVAVRRTCRPRALCLGGHVCSPNACLRISHSGFACTSFGTRQTCFQTATEVILTASCSAGSFVSSESATFPIVYTSMNAENSSTASLLRLPIAAPMIQINWRSEDLATATQPVSTTSIPGGGSGGGSSSSSGSISAGALAGAVIAGVVVIFAIAAAIYRLMKRRRARGNANAELTRDKTMKPPQDGNLGGNTELPASHDRHELSEMRKPSELSGGHGVVELPASSQWPRAVQGQS